jgi:hypothetical protein
MHGVAAQAGSERSAPAAQQRDARDSAAEQQERRGFRHGRLQVAAATAATAAIAPEWSSSPWPGSPGPERHLPDRPAATTTFSAAAWGPPDRLQPVAQNPSATKEARTNAEGSRRMTRCSGGHGRKRARRG